MFLGVVLFIIQFLSFYSLTTQALWQYKRDAYILYYLNIILLISLHSESGYCLILMILKIVSTFLIQNRISVHNHQ